MSQSSAAAPQGGPVFLHVGSPKTGTTFLQNVLWDQRALAAEQGLLLPGRRFHDHYLATLDVRDLADAPTAPPEAAGRWAALVAEAEGWGGTTLISHELFASASAEQAKRAVASFGDREVHIVLTARDLVRQVPAEWQEHIKHRATVTMEGFLADLRADRAHRTWFWQVQDFADVLRRWGATVPAERVHVVTVPPAGADAGTLWTRFATLLGLDPAAFDTTVSRSNSSLGLEQAELLRRVNAELGDRVPLPGPYPQLAKNVLAHRLLAGRPGTRLVLDAEADAFARQRSVEIVADLRTLGYDVVGDLDELVPPPAEAPSSGPTPSDADLAAEGVAAIAGLLDEMARRLAAQRRAEEVARTAREKPVRYMVVQTAKRNRAVGAAHRAYRRVLRRA
ncbi:hypothetical protein [Nocardioides sp. zg-DK7169]|uniref:hypothetical protein n=1 Tax=Nocardioides sp. zg-DK7169 TaxID=2736600 RepID=UPI001554C387|nr:hypothetical protein [Nocardioides sp. zg-DK7169]NPC95900.1 hypothetical protein [Nocardioides sp. zg-DK7169]